MGKPEQRTMGIFEYNEEPSFLDRMHNDQMKRNETCQLNDLKREAKNVPAREARRINKMVSNYEKTKPKRGVTPKPDLDKKPTAPKQVIHDRNKIREKDKYLDQWGPWAGEAARHRRQGDG